MRDRKKLGRNLSSAKIDRVEAQAVALQSWHQAVEAPPGPELDASLGRVFASRKQLAVPVKSCDGHRVLREVAFVAPSGINPPPGSQVGFFWSVLAKQVKPVTVSEQQMMVNSLISQAMTANHDQTCEPLDVEKITFKSGVLHNLPVSNGNVRGPDPQNLWWVYVSAAVSVSYCCSGEKDLGVGDQGEHHG